MGNFENVTLVAHWIRCFQICFSIILVAPSDKKCLSTQEFTHFLSTVLSQRRATSSIVVSSDKFNSCDIYVSRVDVRWFWLAVLKLNWCCGRRHVACKEIFLLNGHVQPLQFDVNVLDSTCGQDPAFTDKNCCCFVYQNDRRALIVSNLDQNRSQP